MHPVGLMLVLTWTTGALTTAHSMQDVCMLGSMVSSTLLMGAVGLGISCTGYLYTVMGTSAMSVVLWLVLISYMDRGYLPWDTNSLAPSYQQCILLLVVCMLGVPVYWYGVLKVELLLTVAHSIHSTYHGTTIHVQRTCYYMITCMVPCRWSCRAYPPTTSPEREHLQDILWMHLWRVEHRVS